MSTQSYLNLPDRSAELLSSNLRKLMQLKNVDSVGLSKETGIALTTIQHLRRGTGNPTLSTLQALSNFFKVSIGHLTEKCLMENKTDQHTTAEIPLIDMHTLESFLFNRLKYNSTIISELYHGRSDNLFAAKINNNSMQPLFDKGTIFIVLDENTACDGDMVLVQFGNNAPCFRKIFIEEEASFFKPISGVLQDTPVKNSNFIIHGIVIKAIQSLLDR